MKLCGLSSGKGDIDGFLGVFIDNLSVFLVIISLNLYVVGMPPEIVFGRILPGAALGLLAGNIYYAYMAKRLAKKEGRTDVTALPSGISIVFAIAYTMGILLPVTKITGNPEMAWIIGIAATVIGGIICLVGAFIGPLLKEFLPSAAMLGALAGLGVIFIAGMGLDDIFSNPYVGFPALAIIIWGYLAKGKLPFKLPAGLLALIVGSVIAIAMGQTAVDMSGMSFYAPIPWIFKVGVQAFVECGPFLGIIIPIAVINFITTLDNIESASSAGDNYPIRETMIVDGFATIIGAAFGCCYPNCVFIGHPGYKRLGALMSYSLISGVALTLLSIFGLFGFISKLVPLAAVTPILIFIGLIMTEVAFAEVKKEHLVASAIALIPFVSEFAKEQIDLALSAANIAVTDELINTLNGAGVNYTGYSALASGTILISMFLAAIVAFAISKELHKVAIVSFMAAICAYFGLIHAPALKFGAEPTLAIAWAGLGALAFIANYFSSSSSQELHDVKKLKVG